jgi:hypothetical protein
VNEIELVYDIMHPGEPCAGFLPYTNVARIVIEYGIDDEHALANTAEIFIGANFPGAKIRIRRGEK